MPALDGYILLQKTSSMNRPKTNLRKKILQTRFEGRSQQSKEELGRFFLGLFISDFFCNTRKATTKMSGRAPPGRSFRGRRGPSRASHSTSHRKEIFWCVFKLNTSSDVTLPHPDAVPSDQPCWLPGMSKSSFLKHVLVHAACITK